MHDLGDLSNEQLLARLRAHVGRGHVWQAELIGYLAEVEQRRLDVEHACPSMWEFCIRILGMSDSEAHLRIAAARVVRRFPDALEYLQRGEIHLCALYALRDHLTDANHDDLLREASGKSTDAVRKMLAARFPRPDVPSRVEPVEPQIALPVGAPDMIPATAAPSARSSARSPGSKPRGRVEPLSATRYRVELTVSAETNAKLERIRDLMRHRNPTGDLEAIVDASLELLLVKLEKERLGKTTRSRKVVTATNAPSAPSGPARPNTSTTNRAATDPDARSDVGEETSTSKESANAETTSPVAVGAAEKIARRSISRDVRRHVFARDGERCTFVDAEGNRCPARGHLELDHIRPKARGGSDEPANLRVLCRSHNALYAEQVFGRAHVEARIRARRRQHAGAASPAAASTSSVEAAARGLRCLGFRDAEVSRAVTALQTKLDPATPVETILREALALLT